MSIEKANQMQKEAEALATKTFPPWGLKEKKQDAIELWGKAAAIYKVSKEWKTAAKCYTRAAETAKLISAEMDACNNYGEAGKALKNIEGEDKEAIKMFSQCAKMHIEANRMVMGGKMYRTVGEMQEKIGDMKGALEAYNLAAEIFYTSDMSSDGHQMMVKVAEHDASTGNYKKAIECYEKVIEASLENKLLSFGVKGHMYMALLCKFCEAIKTKANVVSVMEETIGRYRDQHPALDQSREVKFIEQLVKAWNDEKYEDIVNAINTQNRIYRLTPLQRALCDVIRGAAPGQVVHAGARASTGASASSSAGAGAEPDLQGGGGAEVDLQGAAPARPTATTAAATNASPKGSAVGDYKSGAPAKNDQKTAPAAPSASAASAYAAAASAAPAPTPAASSSAAPTAGPAPSSEPDLM